MAFLDHSKEFPQMASRANLKHAPKWHDISTLLNIAKWRDLFTLKNATKGRDQATLTKVGIHLSCPPYCQKNTTARPLQRRT